MTCTLKNIVYGHMIFILLSPANSSLVFYVEMTQNGRFHVVSTWNTRGMFVGLLAMK